MNPLIKIVGDSTLLHPYTNPNGVVSIQAHADDAPGRPSGYEQVIEITTAGEGGKPTLWISKRARLLFNVVED